MSNDRHYMIDIETTGVDKKEDDILEIGIVEIERRSDGFWYPLRQYHTYLYTAKKPTNIFQLKHQVELFNRCNSLAAPDIKAVRGEILEFIHNEFSDTGLWKTYPKMFMGWNAAGFDMPFMFEKGLLEPSYYVDEDGKQKLKGDAHYRVYEQTGAFKLMQDVTGLSYKSVQALAFDLNPTNIEMPKGKEHDAIYDCYWQIIAMNGMIELARRGWRK